MYRTFNTIVVIAVRGEWVWMSLTKASVLTTESHEHRHRRLYESLLLVGNTGVMDSDETCVMHLTPGVVHNFPKAMDV